MVAGKRMTKKLGESSMHFETSSRRSLVAVARESSSFLT